MSVESRPWPHDSKVGVQKFILSKCKDLVPDFDSKQVIHGFVGARAKNSTGDWIIEESSVNSPHVDVEERTPTRTPFGRASTPHSVPHRRPAERRGGPKDAHGQAASVPREKHLGTHPRHRTRERHGRTEASAMADPATGAVTAPITIKIRQQEPAGEHSLTVAGDVRAPDR